MHLLILNSNFYSVMSCLIFSYSVPMHVMRKYNAKPQRICRYFLYHVYRMKKVFRKNRVEQVFTFFWVSWVSHCSTVHCAIAAIIEFSLLTSKLYLCVKRLCWPYRRSSSHFLSFEITLSYNFFIFSFYKKKVLAILQPLRLGVVCDNRKLTEVSLRIFCRYSMLFLRAHRDRDRKCEK